MKALEILTILLVAITMALALSHALELPGKMRLPRDSYLAMQTVYYPGFTIGGAAEPLGALAVVVLLVLMPPQGFWLAVAALVLLVMLHAIFWIWIQPVNKQWLKGQSLRGASETFFRTQAAADGPQDWTKLRDRWEYAHTVRAGLGLLSLIVLLVAFVG